MEKDSTDLLLKRMDKLESDIEKSNHIIAQEQEKLIAYNEKRKSMVSTIILGELDGMPVRKVVEEIRQLRAQQEEAQTEQLPQEQTKEQQADNTSSESLDAEGSQTANMQVDSFGFDTKPAEAGQEEGTDNGYNMGGF